MELSDTYISVLEILRDKPIGLRTAEIVSEAKRQRMLLIRDASQVSAIVNALRSKKLVTSYNEHTGRVHQITQMGLDALKLTTEPPELTTEPPELTTEAAEQSLIGSVNGLIQGFDEAVSIIRDAMLKSLLAPSPKVADKQRKISVLQRLEMMMSEDISAVLAEIRADLERFEEI